MISSTLQTLGNAGTDTPIVIRWYESLLDEWEKEWERDKLDFSSINIHSMGRAIGALGPDNGQQFIPFMRERAKEAAKVYAAMPDTHIYKHKRQNMKRVYNGYLIALKKISPTKQASTWAEKYASDMGLK
jgi:hypothetical protein